MAVCIQHSANNKRQSKCNGISSTHILSGKKQNLLHILTTHLKGIVHNFFVYRSNLIFWIVMGCGIADFGRRGL